MGGALKGGYIPGGLKDVIKSDSDFRLSLSMESIDEDAFDYKDKRTLADFALVGTFNNLRRYSQVLLSAHSSEETRMHSASELSGHLLSLPSSLTARISSGLKACQPD